jgi:hypothetical protein
MAEQNEVDEDTAFARLEAALDRIAQRAPATAEVASRLDTLIGELRAVLAEPEA